METAEEEQGEMPSLPELLGIEVKRQLEEGGGEIITVEGINALKCKPPAQNVRTALHTNYFDQEYTRSNFTAPLIMGYLFLLLSRSANNIAIFVGT